MKEYDLRDDELWREYILAESGGVYTIVEPQKLYIADSGGHRVLDSSGVIHRISEKDIGVIRWKPKDLKLPVKF
jgi:hypothetical protein